MSKHAQEPTVGKISGKDQNQVEENKPEQEQEHETKHGNITVKQRNAREIENICTEQI